MTKEHLDCHATSSRSRWWITICGRPRLAKRERRCKTESSRPRSHPLSERYDCVHEDSEPLLHTLYGSSSESYSHAASLSSSSIITSDPSHGGSASPLRHCMPLATRLTRLTYMLFTLLLVVSCTSAAPHNRMGTHHLVRRQAIPDRFGNTGNDPAPVASQPPPQTSAPIETSTSLLSTSEVNPSTSTSTTPSPTSSTTTSTSTSTSTSITATPSPPSLPSEPSLPSPPSLPSSSSSPPPTTPTPNGSLGEQLQPTDPISPFTPGVIASIAIGGTLIIATLFSILYFLHRHRRRLSIQEIPIRRSMLVSRLAYRVFGSGGGREASRSSSSASKYTTRSGHEKHYEQAPSTPPNTLNAGNRSTFGSVTAWLDKSTIGRPRPAYVETSSMFLELPRPLFAEREAERDDVRGEGRPRRPDRDAAPLGRLSGMGFGLGMGRWSGMR
ncbi:hypothetical protein BDW02DRAFT_625521 [Decorospora gaudefroyi]|uniref:Uncharacterized protein n=1 Tax=Decorospora gaudefroyi TaxID=184978 RepID=A0A6A5K9C4_9PLEO|nr:hypothetical protein BDW02DRAFT_605981 [Decorospora gaudefroyi]KAF1832507.1 hypothetical protein BDW02DRAFT_625521 [Decorospora gaudefroyi]